jgi:hypothetical protein
MMHLAKLQRAEKDLTPCQLAPYYAVNREKNRQSRSHAKIGRVFGYIECCKLALEIPWRKTSTAWNRHAFSASAVGKICS